MFSGAFVAARRLVNVYRQGEELHGGQEEAHKCRRSISSSRG